MKRAILLAITATVCLTLYSQTEFKIMSYNIRNSWAKDGNNSWSNRREANVKMILSEMPNIIGMQEVCGDQQAYLDSALSLYKNIGVGRDDGNKEGEIMAIFYDTATVSLLQWGTFWLSETPNEPSIGWDAACRRTCTWALFKQHENGKLFLFFNTHLDHVGKTARMMEIRQISDSIKTISSRLGVNKVYLTGDFNTTTKNSIFEPLKEEMNEAREVSQTTDKGYTYNGFGNVDPSKKTHILDANGNTDNEVAIDHIFVKGAKVKKFVVLRGDYGVPFISDHYPVIAIIE